MFEKWPADSQQNFVNCVANFLAGQDGSSPQPPGGVSDTDKVCQGFQTFEQCLPLIKGNGYDFLTSQPASLTGKEVLRIFAWKILVI